MGNNLSYKAHYRRRLPHVQPQGATFFVTFRLAGSLPAEVVKKLMQERERVDFELEKITNAKERMERAYLESRRLFGKWDNELDESTTGAAYLSDPRIADMVAEGLHFRDGKVFDLVSFCIMPNHAHVVFTPLKEGRGSHIALSRIMHSLKRHTAHEANRIMGRTGTFWQHESYDHFVRDDAELDRVVKYVLHNPVKASLVKEETEWKWNYCKYNM
jgi:putative transposase